MAREREREREREKGRFGILLHIANTHIIVLHLVNDLDIPLE